MKENVDYYTDNEIRRWAKDIYFTKVRELEDLISSNERDLASLFDDDVSPEAKAFVNMLYIKHINSLKDKLAILLNKKP